MPKFFSFESKTEYADASGSKINPSKSIPTFSRHVFKSLSIFLAIVTRWTVASSLWPDNPSGFLIFLLLSTFFAHLLLIKLNNN